MLYSYAMNSNYVQYLCIDVRMYSVCYMYVWMHKEKGPRHCLCTPYHRGRVELNRVYVRYGVSRLARTRVFCILLPLAWGKGRGGSFLILFDPFRLLSMPIERMLE